MTIMLGMGVSSLSGIASRNWTEAAFPVALLQSSIPGYVYDPTHPSNTVTGAGGGGAPVLGGPVGRIQGFSPDLIDSNVTQPTDALRPTLENKGGKRAFVFNGTDQFIAVNSQPVGDWLSLPRSFTVFAMLWRDTAVPASDVSPAALSRGEISSSFFRPYSLNSTLGLHGHTRLGGTTFVNDLVGLATFPVGQWVEVIAELAITEMSVDSVGTQTGTLKYWVNDLPEVSHNILPDRSSTASITSWNRYIIGAQYSQTTVQQYWAGGVGRNGWIGRALDSTQRAQLRNWMRGTTYIAP